MDSRLTPILFSTVLTLSLVCAANAGTSDGIPAKKQTELGLYLTATDAYKLKSEKSDVIFVDIRTRAEIAFVGMPQISDANIPYAIPGDWDNWDEKKKTFKLEPNSSFLLSIDDLVKVKGGNKETHIILMCRSGSRSAKATNLLKKSGYSNVYTVVDGFEGDKAKSGDLKGQRVVNGWKNSGLPWSYKLDKNKMYDM
ncbi:MAG: rhodanese-like domain-containing protein [Candidatus Thiodiazotropha sp.]